MVSFHNSDEYLFNLHATSSSEAKRLWKKNIKDKWDNKCAYCNSENNLTLDHITPQSKGGTNFTKNIVCCCHSCNQSKGHSFWEEWYFSQEFFSHENYEKIKIWMKPDPEINLFRYAKKRNNFVA
jgi:hypothetical protein